MTNKPKTESAEAKPAPAQASGSKGIGETEKNVAAKETAKKPWWKRFWRM